MGKNLLILLLLGFSAASWIWPRFGTLPEPIAPVEMPASAPPPRAVSNSVPLAPDSRKTLDELMHTMQHTRGFEAASLGLSVFSDHEEPFFSYRAEEAMTPASTLKAVTSASAMTLLGPGARFETHLDSSVPWVLDEQGQFQGDLILVGGGDPMLSESTLVVWVNALSKRGLKQLAGRVVADARYFPEQLIPNAWDWGDVSNYYGAGPSGLNLEFNRFEVTFSPGKAPGEPAILASMTPPLDWITRLNLAPTSDAGASAWISIYGGPYTSTLTFRGSIPMDQPAVSAHGSIPDPAFHAADRFTHLLEKAGIRVSGSPSTMRRLLATNDALPSAETRLLSHPSEPLQEIIRYLHRTSDNMVTECLFQKLIAADPLGRDGRTVIAMPWEKRGVGFLGLRMEDGSGLARADAIRPLDLAHVLWLMRRSPHGEAYWDTLNEYHSGRVRWKGGAMSRVRAYTGYTDNGYTFALMINQYEASADELAHWRDAIVEHVLALPPVPAPLPGQPATDPQTTP